MFDVKAKFMGVHLETLMLEYQVMFIILLLFNIPFPSCVAVFFFLNFILYLDLLSFLSFVLE